MSADEVVASDVPPRYLFFIFFMSVVIFFWILGPTRFRARQFGGAPAPPSNTPLTVDVYSNDNNEKKDLMLSTSSKPLERVLAIEL